jgi:hypothetical protein
MSRNSSFLFFLLIFVHSCVPTKIDVCSSGVPLLSYSVVTIYQYWIQRIWAFKLHQRNYLYSLPVIVKEYGSMRQNLCLRYCSSSLIISVSFKVVFFLHKYVMWMWLVILLQLASSVNVICNTYITQGLWWWYINAIIVSLHIIHYLRIKAVMDNVQRHNMCNIYIFWHLCL